MPPPTVRARRYLTLSSPDGNEVWDLYDRSFVAHVAAIARAPLTIILKGSRNVPEMEAFVGALSRRTDGTSPEIVLNEH